MIIAFSSHDKNSNASLFKPFVEMKYEKQNNLLQLLESYISRSKESEETGSFESESWSIALIKKGQTYHSIVSDDDTNTESFYILNYLKPLLSDDMYDNLFLIDEVFTFLPSAMNVKNMVNYNLLPIETLKEILKGESKEEKAYMNMLKSKELDSYQKMKNIKKGKPDNIEKQLEKVRSLELEMRNEQLKQIEKLKNEVKEMKPEKRTIKKQQRVSVDGDFVITIKEKLNIRVDKDSNIKECFINGDLSVLVKNENMRKEEIIFKKKKDVDTKFSPNVDKGKTDKNILYSERGYPLNKNVALMKWKKDAELPFNFTFWVSEINEEKNMVQFEIEKEQKMKDLIFYFNKKKGVVIENKNVISNSSFEWRVGDEDNLEIICNDYEDIFPILVDFWSDSFKPTVEVKNNLNVKIVKIFEVEKFEIIY